MPPMNHSRAEIEAFLVDLQQVFERHGMVVAVNEYDEGPEVLDADPGDDAPGAWLRFARMRAGQTPIDALIELLRAGTQGQASDE